MKLNFKKLIAILLVLVILVGTVTVSMIYMKKQLKAITLNESAVSIKTEETVNLTATLEPADTNNTELKWYTDNDKIATVSAEGKVIGVGPGVATVTCESTDKPDIKATCQVSVISPAPEISAENAVVYNMDTGNVIMTKKADAKIAPASLAKIVTACVALKYAKADNIFTVGTELSLVKSGSSICQIGQGHKLTLKDLICGMLVSSGNDAAYAIAANIARVESGNSGMSDKAAIEHFCDLMNSFAKEIGMENSNFTSPDGWDDDEQYTTAKDLATVTKYATEIEEIKEVVAYDSEHVTFASGQHITWTNTNLMLNKDSDFYNENVTGFKTGSTTKAGKCLVSTYESTEGNFIIVVTGCDTDAQRYTDTQSLIDWAIENRHA